jgi:GNAT superfamily N-acetyltransferase
MLKGDAEAVATLAGQLGYPSTAAQVLARVAVITSRTDAAALVAERGGEIVGWLHVELRHTLVADHEAQVMALVVDESHRSQGVGAALMSAAEDWARAHGAERVRVGSRITRTDAHRFYERMDYGLSKTSRWFEKRL